MLNQAQTVSSQRLFISTHLISVCVQFVVHEAPGQELEVELYDEDTDKDDFLGRSDTI